VKKLLLGVILAALLSLVTQPVLADSESFITGGGILLEGQGKDAQKITFGVNVSVDDGRQPSGHLQVNFHNTLFDDLDKGKFKSTSVDELWTEQKELDGVPYTFVSIIFYGQFNGEDGWKIDMNFADFGEPGRAKPDSGNKWDAVRISLFNPSDESVWDSAYEEVGFPREQSWRTLLDGGNIKVHY
jgi:hypothetical protein